MTPAGDQPRPRPRRTFVVNRISDEFRRAEHPDAIEIVPFVRGRRPTLEARHPGLGSSDHAALILGGQERNRAYVLFRLPEGADVARVEARLSFTGHDGREPEVPVAGWNPRRVPLRCFAEDGSLRPARTGDSRFVLELDPERDLTGEGDRYGFAHLFLQRVRVRLALGGGEEGGSTAETTLDVCDVRRLGRLYERILERVVKPDALRQASAAGMRTVDHSYHPWFPVLLIGSDKAALYTRALVGDIVHKQRHLIEPAWLLRVGLYLELLTCLGIAEAVRGDVGDLLTEGERAAFEGDRFAAVRERLDPDAWREVWELREIAFPRHGMFRAGPVSLANLVRKKRATLAFLHAHHEDLKRAIELAGPNRDNAQETWQRVFRDAERAVLRQTPHAFAELGYLPRAARELVLWHRQGRLDVVPILRVPKVVAGLFADQDGLFPAACNQYRESMNAVAAWARERSLMHVSGRECIPPQVSLLEAHMNAKQRVAQLQRRDGYGERLDVTEAADATEPPLEDAEELLASVAVFRMLSPDELQALARAARPLALGPTERFLIQDTEGSSLFVVADGEVEVVVRRPGKPDLRVATLGRGAVLGEMSLLTGERRSATVRAVDGALVYEIGRHQYEPHLRAHHEWIDELVTIMEARLRERDEYLAAYDSERRGDLGHLVRRHFFGRGAGAAAPAD